MPFTEIFGNQTILPSDPSYLALTMAANKVLLWPVEQQVGGDLVVSTIIDIDATAPGLNVDMPNATLVSPGTAVIFNNVGGNTVTVRDSIGGTIISLVSGSVWIAYLTDNTTPEGTWKVFQFGASVSVANAAALAGAGLKAITTTLNTRIAVSSKNANYVIVEGDRAVALVWTSGVGAFTLPAAGTVGADWYTIVRNSGNGDLTVTPPSGLIDGAANKTFAAGTSAFIVCDGVNYFTIGFGAGAGGGGSGFGFIVIPVPGSGDYTLSGAELGQIGYRFTGILTGTRNIIVPGSTEEYWVDNQTTGAFSLFVKTVAQVPGVEVLQNNRNILYSDGTNVIAAESATVSFPIPVAQGGTGAVTAAAARTNLGATATGAALFTAADAAAARTAIAAVPTSRNLTAGAGLTGGGDLSADRAFAVDFTDSYFPLMKRRTTVLTRANQAVPTADTVLAGWVLQPSRIYRVTGVLQVGSQTSTANGFAWNFTFAGGTANMDFTDGGIMLMVPKAVSSSSGSYTYSGGRSGFLLFTTATTPKLCYVDYLFGTGAGFTPGGVLDFNWSQQTSDAVGTRLEDSSYLILQRVN